MSDVHPNAGQEAEARIRLLVVSGSVIAVAMLVGGLALLFGGNVLLGAVLALTGTVDLIALPFISGALRRRAIAAETRDQR